MNNLIRYRLCVFDQYGLRLARKQHNALIMQGVRRHQPPHLPQRRERGAVPAQQHRVAALDNREVAAADLRQAARGIMR